MLKRKCYNKGNVAADDGCAFPVISNEIVLNGWNIVFSKSQVVHTQCGIALLEQGSWNCIKEEMRVLCSEALLRGAIILKTQKAIEASWANSNFSKKQTAAIPVLQIRK